MRKWMMGLMAGMVLSLVGCGDSTPAECDDLSSGLEAYEEKGRNCATASNPLPTFNTSQCPVAIKDCSAEEKKALADFAACLRAMPTCAVSGRATFDEALHDCSLPADLALGEACGEVLDLD
jgi:hypothetical protein